MKKNDTGFVEITTEITLTKSETVTNVEKGIEERYTLSVDGCGDINCCEKKDLIQIKSLIETFLNDGQE